MIAEKKLTKALIDKAKKMGWKLDSPTYQGVMRYAFAKFHDYFVIVPYAVNKWNVWFIIDCEHANTLDGKLNEVDLITGAKSYEDAMCRAVQSFVDDVFEGWQETDLLLSGENPQQKIEAIKEDLRKAGFYIK